MVTASSRLSRSQIIFVILHGILIAFLGNFLAVHISEDHSTEMMWTLGGLPVGIASGLLIFKIVTQKLNTIVKQWVWLLVLIVFELTVGLILVIPYIFVLMYFEYPSENHSICCETPNDYGAREFENINISRADGENISGWYIPPTTKAHRIIILLHGAGSDRRATRWHSTQLIEAGYGVLTYDLRGHGESFGKLTMFNDMEKHTSDLLAMVRHINPTETNQVAVLGLSMGAYVTLNLKPEELNKFSALWMDGLRGDNIGADSVADNLSDLAMNILMKPINPIAELYSGEKAPPSSTNFINIIPTISKPKLMLVASELDYEENTFNQTLLPLMKNNKEMWFIADAWHIGGPLRNTDEYRNRMLVFFERAFTEN